MAIRNLNWMDVERYLERDECIVLPLGVLVLPVLLELGG
jgi:hypothetical protein